jgi:hypothetical protein
MQTKIVNESFRTARLGVNAFERYCLKHNPIIIWREESTADFGIDGELELCSINEDKKTEPSGKILKVQLKSTLKDSFISNETESGFTFNAKEKDIDYWLKHNNEVILVIYLQKEDGLYARKVTEVRKARKKVKTIPVYFEKVKNRLIDGDNDFTVRFANYFKDRVDYSVTETILSNIIPYTRLPKYVYEYDAKIESYKELDPKIKRDEIPVHINYGKKIYTFINLKGFSSFNDLALKNTNPKQIPFKKFLVSNETKNYSIELLNKYFKNYCETKGIGFNKQYLRYYFRVLFREMKFQIDDYAISRIKRLNLKEQIMELICDLENTKYENINTFKEMLLDVFKDEEDPNDLINEIVSICLKPIEENFDEKKVRKVYRRVEYNSKTEEEQDRGVVVYFDYHNKSQFIRHYAFDANHLLIDDKLYLAITPKFLFTNDCKKVLENKKRVTSLTNALTKQQYNNNFVDYLYFIFHYLSNNKKYINISEIENSNISLGFFWQDEVNFGIANEQRPKIENSEKAVQTTLF